MTQEKNEAFLGLLMEMYQAFNSMVQFSDDSFERRRLKFLRDDTMALYQERRARMEEQE